MTWRSTRLVAALSLGCAHPAAQASSPSLVESPVTSTAGGRIVVACSPTQAEIRFNAIDDNCNGVIDEGCGVHTGLLQFTIAWSVSACDVNLLVEVPPEGRRVPDTTGDPKPTGFHRDRDCPGEDGCGGQNVENIYFDGSKPPRGRYVVDIVLTDMHGVDPPIVVTFGARLGTRSVSFEVPLASGADAHRSFSFDLP